MKQVFSKIFQKKNKANKISSKHNDSTVPLTENQLQDILNNSSQVKPKQLVVGAARDVGRQRHKNEDSLFTMTALIDANDSTEAFGLFIIADGMGGHLNGEVASEMAVRVLADHLLSELFPAIFSLQGKAPENTIREILLSAVSKANDLINKHTNGGGTTLTAVLCLGSQMNIAHVGDSRAYAIHPDDRVQTLTRDHSLVQRLFELGQITAEEVDNHPQKSTLYNSVGQSAITRPDIFIETFPEPGYLMVCSDGLWGVLSENEIHTIIFQAKSPQVACQQLVNAANAAGGPDNISVILVKYSE